MKVGDKIKFDFAGKKKEGVVDKLFANSVYLKVVIKTMLTVPNIESIITKNQKAVVARNIQAITDLKVVIKIMLTVPNIEIIITQKMVTKTIAYIAHIRRNVFSVIC